MKLDYGSAIKALKKYSPEGKIFLIYLAIALVLFWYITINITGSVPRGYGDVYQSMFNLWWVPYAVFTLHASPYFTNLLYYPVGANFVTQTMSPLAGILTWPIQQLSPTLAYNIMFFLGFALSGLFMYLLADYVTGNKYAAFIAGIIFAFSPMHIAQAQAHLDWTIIEFVPLFTLFFLRSIFEGKRRYPIYAGISFILLAFMGDVEQGIMVFLFAIILAIILLIIERKEIRKGNMAMNIGIMVITIIILSLPFIASMAPHFAEAFNESSQLSNIPHNLQWSDNLASFFLPSYYNAFFHNASLNYANQTYALTYQGTAYSINVGERVSYIGYSVLILMILGIYYDYKRNKFKHSPLWIIIFAIYFLLSLGPYVEAYATVTGIPTLYSIYLHIPYLNLIREPGRFDMITTIAIAVLASLGAKSLVENKEHKRKVAYVAVITIIILAEYAGFALPPFSSQLVQSSTIPQEYYQIGNITGNFSVLMLPSLPQAGARPAEYTGLETYYITATKKPLIGGYTGRTNSTETLSVSLIPLSSQSQILQYANTLTYASPINQNVTNETLLFLALYNTSFITVLRDAYSPASQQTLYSYLSSVFGQGLVTNSSFVFSTKAAIAEKSGRSIIAYPVGTSSWVSGSLVCYFSSGPCNQTLARMWIGNNYRNIIAYSPNSTAANVTMQGITYDGNKNMYVYVNGRPSYNITLSNTAQEYSFNISLNQGFNQFTLYQPNSTSSATVPYLTFGVYNITFSPVR